MQTTFHHLDLFSGIGGFALATEMVWPNVEHVFCDIEPFSQAVLRKHWPRSMIYGDIRSLTADAESERNRRLSNKQGAQDTHSDRPAQKRIDLLTGGFPCQPFSAAGKRKGTADDRHLWPEMLRVIREFHPRWIIGENVGGFITWNDGLVFEQVCSDLEAAGYEVQAFIIPAVAVGAPHRRDRVWIVAHTSRVGARSESGETSNEKGSTRKDRREGIRQAHRTIGASRAFAADTDAPNTYDPRLQGCGEEGPGLNEITGRKGSDKGPNWSENWSEVAARLCLVDYGLPGGLARPRGWRNAALKGAGNAIVPQVAAEIMRAIKSSDI